MGKELKMAGLTRLELAASCVTGRRSNQLNYNPDSIYDRQVKQLDEPLNRLL